MKFTDINASTAAEAIGGVSSGLKIFGFTKGQYGLIDIIRHLVSFGGDWSLAVSAWQATGEALARLASIDGIKSARFIIDSSFATRQPAYAWQMCERFGADSLVVTKSHAKFALLRSAALNLCIRTSMNLNEESRIEMFEIDDSAELCDIFERSVSGKSAKGLIKPAQGNLFYA